jgi:uncharacterized protein with NRDE domain
MCLILLACDAHPLYRLIVAANRDEFHDRPTAPASFWDDAPQLLAGRDLSAGGTWLGTTRNGRFAALTNYREPSARGQGAPSRGELVSEFLRSEIPAPDYLDILRRRGDDYQGFGLIFGTAEQLHYFTNREGCATEVATGIHGLSNHLLDTPWPKVARGREALAQLLASNDIIPTEKLYTILADRSPAPDHLLPDTGVGREWERILSSMFISTTGYGTRSSTVILFGRDNRVTFSERTFNGNADDPRTATFDFLISR